MGAATASGSSKEGDFEEDTEVGEIRFVIFNTSISPLLHPYQT